MDELLDQISDLTDVRSFIQLSRGAENSLKKNIRNTTKSKSFNVPGSKERTSVNSSNSSSRLLSDQIETGSIYDLNRNSQQIQTNDIQPGQNAV